MYESKWINIFLFKEFLLGVYNVLGRVFGIGVVEMSFTGIYGLVEEIKVYNKGFREAW